MSGVISANWQRLIKALKRRRASIVHNEGISEGEWDKGRDQNEGQKIISALERITDQAEKNANQVNAEENGRRSWERRRFWLDVTAVLVAAVATFYVIKQQNTMQEQLEEMQAEQRAFMSPVSAQMTDMRDETTGVIGTGLQVIWQNNGNTPATHVKAWVNFAPVIGPIPNNFKFPDLNFSPPHPTFVAPKGPLFMSPLFIKDDDVAAIMARVKHGYVWGWITYRDSLGSVCHATEFCDELVITKSVTPGDPSKAVSSSIMNCPVHNCMDGECQDHKQC